MRPLPILLVAAAAGSLVVALRSSSSSSSSVATPSVVPESLDLVFAQPFVLDEPYVHYWRAERPLVDSGWILIVQTDPAKLVRRQHAEPVLYVGDQTAERMNNGDVSGRVVCLVPCDLDPAGFPLLDPAAAPMWLGSPDLPERVDADTIQAERAAAQAFGVAPPSGATLATALQSGGGTLYLVDRVELEAYVADLVSVHAPAETDLVQRLRLR